MQNVLLLLAVLGFGSLVRAVYPKEQSRVDGAALTLLGGLGVLGMLVFCVGQYWFTRISIVLVLSVGILLSLPPFLEFVRHWRLWLADLRAPILPLAIILVVLLVTAISGKVIVESTTLWHPSRSLKGGVIESASQILGEPGWREVISQALRRV